MPSGVRVDESQRQAITADMNLRRLKSIDPAVLDVLCSSSQVAVYELPAASEGGGAPQWARRDIEGSLYIVSRAPGLGEASHRVVVLNRKSPQNFVDDIVPANMDLEAADQMIMFRSPASHVTGLWFYVPEEMERVFAFIRAIVDESPLPQPPVAAAAAPPTAYQRRPESHSGTGRKVQSSKNGTPSKQKRKSKIAQSNRIASPSPSPSLSSSPSPSPSPSPPHAAADGDSSGPSEPVSKAASGGDFLARFFPDLKLTNGVAGSSSPVNASHAEPGGSPPVIALQSHTRRGEATGLATDVTNSVGATATVAAGVSAAAIPTPNARATGAPTVTPTATRTTLTATATPTTAGGPTTAGEMVNGNRDSTEMDSKGHGAVPLNAQMGFPGLLPPLGMMPYPHFPSHGPPPTPGLHSNGMHPLLPHQYHMMMLQSMYSLQALDQKLSSQLQQISSQPSNVHSTRQVQVLQQEVMQVRRNIAQLQSQLMQNQQAISQGAGPSLATASTNFPGAMNAPRMTVPLQAAPGHTHTQSHPAPPPSHAEEKANVDCASRETMADKATSVGQAVSLTARGIHGVNTVRLDRTQFRALLQRMLTDKKLFDTAFHAYEGIEP